MSKALLVLILLFSGMANAEMGPVSLSGYLKSFDAKTATLKGEKGEVIVPLSSIDKNRQKIGQWIEVFLDFDELIRLNKNQIDKLNADNHAK